MEILSFIYLSVYLAQISVSVSGRFLVVSPFSDEEISQPTVHHLRISEHFPIEEDTQTKDETCRTIAESPFIHNTLRILPIRPERPEIFWKMSLIKTPSDITGPYKSREILINGNISHEVVFPCSTWKYETGKFVDIFISRQFNSHHNMSRNQLFSIPFRLVFTQDETEKLVTVAIAEEPGSVSKFEDGGKCPTEEPSDFQAGLGSFDFEELTKSMRLRLCGLILNAEMYRHEISLVNDDEPQCNQQDIWYTCKILARDKYGSYNVESECKKDLIPTLECKGMKKRRISFHKTEVFYIIEGNDFNSYFIARNLGGKIKIVDRCSL